MIRILADKNIPFLSESLLQKAEIILYDPSKPFPAVPADALLVRTVSAVNAASLSPVLECASDEHPLRFIGTASAGTDHVDTGFLRRAGIGFASAAGCNAQAVAEYVITGILYWSAVRNIAVETLRIGIIGVGNTGGRVAALCKKLDWTAVLYDPPREIQDPTFRSAPWEEVLSCDIITLHVPLTAETRYMLGPEQTSGKHGQTLLIVNAARGGVIREEVVFETDVILDVWDGEPHPDKDVVRNTFLATPHIAGYSQEAKIAGTRMVVEALFRFFGEAGFGKQTTGTRYDECEAVEPENGPSLSTQNFGNPGEKPKRADIIREVHPLFRFDAIMKSGEFDFTRLRNQAVLRREFSGTRVPAAWLRMVPELGALGVLPA